MVFSVTLLIFLDMFAVLPDVLSGGGALLPDQLPGVEVLCLGPPSHRRRERSENLLHHGEMLSVVVRLEQREPEVQLEHYTAYAPNITGLGPSQLQNNFRGSVVSS